MDFRCAVEAHVPSCAHPSSQQFEAHQSDANQRASEFRSMIDDKHIYIYITNYNHIINFIYIIIYIYINLIIYKIHI